VLGRFPTKSNQTPTLSPGSRESTGPSDYAIPLITRELDNATLEKLREKRNEITPRPEALR
jgi:hypothetical protein